MTLAVYKDWDVRVRMRAIVHVHLRLHSKAVGGCIMCQSGLLHASHVLGVR